jgi:hypothetical protein
MSWTTAPWTGDEKPLLAARAAVDAAAKRPGFTEFVNTCAEASRMEPSNTIAAFKWAYATWVAGLQSKSAGVLNKMLFDARSAVEHDEFGNTYNGARIRYLYEVPISVVPNPRLKPLGERLLNHTDKDFSVLLGVAGLCRYRMQQGNYGDKSRAIELCQEAHLLEPGSPLPFGGLATCYEVAANFCDGWGWEDNANAKMTAAAQNDFQLAIVYLEQDIAHTAPDDPWHAHLVKDLTAWRTVLKQHGTR